MVSRSGATLVVAIVCIISAVTVVNAALGPQLGITKTTGLKDDVDTAESTFGNETDGSVTEQGAISPLSAVSKFAQSLSLLPKFGQLLVNLGVHPAIAGFVSGPAFVIAGITLVALAMRVTL
jgi:hypothetical protein